jgi:hypothetical protein
LSEAFYIDGDMITDAIAHRSEFNLIELQTMFKIDVFVPMLDIVTRRRPLPQVSPCSPLQCATVQ